MHVVRIDDPVFSGAKDITRKGDGINMEALTTLKGVGADLLAWCPMCKRYISDVEVIQDCHPYNRDYAYCSDCHTGIIRSE